jgi:small subunit ribosomal protein S14
MASRFSAVKQIWNRYKQSIQYLPSFSSSFLNKDSLLSKSFSWTSIITKKSFKIKNRCVFSNRSRAVFSKLKVTRMVFKNLATHGYLNGVKKHSW